jgi:hypothetical protein
MGNSETPKRFLTCIPVKTAKDAIEFKEVAMAVLEDLEERGLVNSSVFRSITPCLSLGTEELHSIQEPL